MSPSGAELLRQVKSQIDEVDPSEVHELIGEGVGDRRRARGRGVRGRSPPRRQARAQELPGDAHRGRRARSRRARRPLLRSRATARPGPRAR